jgi:hypothetical protein
MDWGSSIWRISSPRGTLLLFAIQKPGPSRLRPSVASRPESLQLVAMELFEIRGGKITRRWGARDDDSQVRHPGPRLSSGVARSQTPDPQEGLRLSRQNSCRGPMPGLRPGNVGPLDARQPTSGFGRTLARPALMSEYPDRWNFKQRPTSTIYPVTETGA